MGPLERKQGKSTKNKGKVSEKSTGPPGAKVKFPKNPLGPLVHEKRLFHPSEISTAILFPRAFFSAPVVKLNTRASRSFF